MVRASQKQHRKLRTFYTGGSESPILDGQGNWALLTRAVNISRRLNGIFVRDASGRRPVAGGLEPFQSDPHWQDLILFHEFFHGDTRSGVGANHQTGWTRLVAKLLAQSGEANLPREKASAKTTTP